MENASPAQIEDPTNWVGGFYELAIEMGPRDDSRLDEALRTLWIAAGATGPFVGSAEGTYMATELSLRPFGPVGHLRGTVEAPPFGTVVAGMLAIRLLDDGEDWLIFYLPLGALSRAHPAVGGYPFGGYRVSVWRPTLDAWLASLGTQVYSAVPFVRANLGMESMGQDTELDGHLVPENGILRYIPGTLEDDA